MQSQGRVMALDYGSRRIGLALSDPEGRFAFPDQALERHGLRQDLEALCALVDDRRVTRIVVGLPIHLDGRSGIEAEAARAFADSLAEATGLPVDMLDERWTTREAERALRGVKGGLRRTGRGAIDSAAAAILLRTYLERERER